MTYTIHELITEPQFKDEVLEGMEESILLSVLKVLEQNGKCALRKDRQGRYGVFFAKAS